jgi:hypothetical protein
VPPFKAFIAFAQDLIAGPIPGEAWPMADDLKPSTFLRRVRFAGRSGMTKKHLPVQALT